MSKDVLRGHKKNLDVLRTETALKFIQNTWLTPVPSFYVRAVESLNTSINRVFQARAARRGITHEERMRAFAADIKPQSREQMCLLIFSPMEEAIQKTLDTCTTVEEAKARLHYLFFKNTKTFI